MLFFVQIISTYNLDINEDDKKFSSLICNGDKEALSHFQSLYSDELYYIASKFNNRGIPQESWEYRTKTGYTVLVTDDVADTYVWLVKTAKNKSCQYRGDKGATFATYIKVVLNSDYTFKDWLKWKTGVTGYIPKCIKNLSESHQQVYKLLRQKKDMQKICDTFGIKTAEYYSIYSTIEEELINSNQIDLIHEPKIISMDHHQENDEDNRNQQQFASKEFVNPNLQPDIKIINILVQTIIKNLSEAERRLIILYWVEKYTIEQIYRTFMLKLFKKYKDELGISRPKDIYTTINKLIKRSYKLISTNYTTIVNEYEITEQSTKLVLKKYLNYFGIN